MESTADVVGVGILLFPVEEEEKAPSPSELPMPNFGFQGTIQSDLGQLRGLVCTPVDHFLHSLHVACPLAFHQLLDVTFLDVTVFHRCRVGMSSIMSNLRSRFQSFPGWNQRYAWGCKWSASLPVARILPKPSKAFMKARPIIACDHCWHSRLTAFLAKGVFQIMLVVLPPGSTFNMLSVQQVIRTMWHSMMSFHAAEPANMTQQDLIGFFNSVPHDRFLQALTYTLFLLQEQWGEPWQEQSLQLSFRNKDSNFRVFRGRRRFAARNTRTMHLEDLPDLTAFMLQSSYFQCGAFIFRQIQGAVGSALAPVLCTLVASTTEFLWLRNFRNISFNIGLRTAVRYADNRAFHFHEGLRRNSWTQLLLNLEFYGPPVLLEYVHEKSVGTVCSVVQGTIATSQPTDSTVLRTLQSVGSREHVLSGFQQGFGRLSGSPDRCD